MDKILEFINLHLILDVPLVIVVSLLFILFIVQLYFYFGYYKLPISYFKKNGSSIPVKYNADNCPSVSVIIISKNDSESLKVLLPLLLKQNYSNFEIIVVNDGATDESQYYVESLAKKDSRVYYTFLPLSEDLNSNRRKILAMTIGIKAAKNDILLFTEPSCRPLTNNWIKSMIDGFDNDIEIVLGYNKFNPPVKLWGRICRFDNLLFSLQFLSMAIKNKPFIGTYRNIAYRKHLFFENKGFSKTLNFDNSEEVFLNRIMNANNTAVVESEDSFTDIEIKNYQHWKHLKSIYIGAKKYFEGYTSKRFFWETFSRYLFYIILFALVGYTLLMGFWLYFIVGFLLYIIRFCVQILILESAAKHFLTKPFHFSIFVLDLLQPIYNFIFCNYLKRK